MLFLSNRDCVLPEHSFWIKYGAISFDGESRTVDIHIRTLRQKLKDAGHYIRTVRGIGYKVGGRMTKNFQVYAFRFHDCPFCRFRADYGDFVSLFWKAAGKKN